MGCTNSKERPRTPPPDAALQNVVSDGDGFWAANGEQRASREATPLKAAADPFQTVDLTNPETAAAASTPAPAPHAEDRWPPPRRADGAGARPRRRLRRSQGARFSSLRPPRRMRHETRKTAPGRPRLIESRRRGDLAAAEAALPGCAHGGADAGAADDAPAARDGLDSGGGALTHATTTTDPRAGVTIKNAGGFSLAEAVAAPPTSPVAAIPEAFTAAFGAPPTPVVKQEAESGETKADANTAHRQRLLRARGQGERPAPVAEAPAAATATAGSKSQRRDGGDRGGAAAGRRRPTEALPRPRDARRPQENQQKEEERKQKEVRTTPPLAHPPASVAAH